MNKNFFIPLLVLTVANSISGINPEGRLFEEISKSFCSSDLRQSFAEAMRKRPGMDRRDGRANGIEVIPGYCFKEEADRLIGAKLYNEVIQKKQLDLLFVPDKCAALYGNNIWIAAKKVDNFSDKPLNLEQVKQLCTLVRKTWAWDFHEENIKPTTDGRVAILDTKLARFQKNKSERAKGLMRMRTGLYQSVPMTKEAKKYLKNEIQREKDNEEIAQWFQDELIKEGAADILKAYRASRTRSYSEYWN